MTKEIVYRKDDAQGAIAAIGGVKEPKNYALDSERDLYGEVDLFSWGSTAKEKVTLSYAPQYDDPYKEVLHYRNGSFTVYTFTSGGQRKQQVVKYSETEGGYPHKTIGSAFRAAVIIAKAEIAKYK